MSWLLLQLKAWMMSRASGVSFGYARRVLWLMDAEERGEISEKVLTQEAQNLGELYPDDYKRARKWIDSNSTNWPEN